MDPVLQSALTLSAVGMTVVFVALSLIAGALALVARVDRRWQAREEVARVAATEATPTEGQPLVEIG